MTQASPASAAQASHTGASRATQAHALAPEGAVMPGSAAGAEGAHRAVLRADAPALLQHVAAPQAGREVAHALRRVAQHADLVGVRVGRH